MPGIAGVARRVIATRGSTVTLRTWAVGAKDAEYEDAAHTPVEREIRVIHDFPRSDRRASDASGGEYLVGSIFHVLPEDAPVLTPGEQNPEIVADGITYVVRTVGPIRGGQRELLCSGRRR